MQAYSVQESHVVLYTVHIIAEREHITPDIELHGLPSYPVTST